MYRNDRPVAILLAVYNGEKYLAEQIDSLLAQSFRDWTLYIRDDGSADATPQIIGRYCRAYPDRIFALEDADGNLGCRGNFFRLLETVDSPYYMFCDGDDVWLPEKVGTSFEAIRRQEEQYPGIPILVQTDKTVCDEHLNVVAPSEWRAAGRNPDLFVSLKYIPILCVGGATAIFNRALRDRMFPLPADAPMHDRWLSLQAARYGRIFSVHRPLMLYRQHGRNAAGAAMARYTFPWRKIKRLPSILRRDYGTARYYQRLGYGCFLKYFVARALFIVKMQYSKRTCGKKAMKV